VVVHSFHGILRKPRTLHTLELPGGYRVPLPRPVPLVSLIYFCIVLAGVMVADNVVSLTSIIGGVLSRLSGGDTFLAAWVICYVGIPGLIVWLSMNVEIDGRVPHRWIVSSAKFVVRPKRTWCGSSIRREGARVAYRGRVSFWWDSDSPRLVHGWVRGGRVTTTVPVRFTHSLRHRHRVMASDDGYMPTVDHDVDGDLEVRP
jgi:TcpE family